MAKPTCQFPPETVDSTGCVPFEAFARAAQLDCELPAGLCFTFEQVVKDKHGHTLDGDFDPKGHAGCDHRDTPEWQAEHPIKEKKMSKKQHEEPKHEAPKHEEAAPVAAMQEVAADKLKAVTEQPAAQTAAAELSGIIGQDITGMQVVMALVAVGGGGAAWKFYRQRSKEKHEERMAELDAHKPEKKESKKKDDHGSCAAARVALEARVAAAEAKSASLEAKLAEMEKKSAKSVEFDGFDPEDAEERIERLEKALKKLLKAKQSDEDDDDDDEA